MSDSPIVSIVIPTYNRADLIEASLKHHLKMAETAPLATEVIVSDNNSTDVTVQILERYEDHPNFRALRRASNGGVYANMYTGFAMARGTYVAYLGDDDALLEKPFYQAIARLQDVPEIVMWQAPWNMYDANRGVSLGQFYQIASEQRFTKNNYLTAFDAILNGHIFPEVGIYRRDQIFAMFGHPNDIGFVFFLNFMRALTLGDVILSPEPFATFTAVAKDHDQVGTRDAMEKWDHYRGGLEIALSYLVEQGKVTGQDYAKLRQRVAQFVESRQRVALRLNQHNRNWVEAFLLHRRLVFAQAAPNKTEDEIKILRIMAATQDAVRQMISMGAKAICVDPAIKDDVLERLPPQERTYLSRDVNTTRAEAPFRRAFLAANDAFPTDQRDTDLRMDIRQSMKRFF